MHAKNFLEYSAAFRECRDIDCGARIRFLNGRCVREVGIHDSGLLRQRSGFMRRQPSSVGFPCPLRGCIRLAHRR